MDTAEDMSRNEHTRPRTWLRDVEPAGIEYDDWIIHVRWGDELDAAIARLRLADPHVDALFRIADGEGLAIAPVWPREGGDPHPLSELVETIRDTDWIMITAATVWRSSFTADMIVHPLALDHYSQHRSPAWTIYVTAH